MLVQALQRLANGEPVEGRRRGKLTFGWPSFLPWTPKADSGIGYVSTSTLLTLTAAHACIRLLANQLATLPLAAYRRSDHLRLEDQPRWLRRLDPEMTLADSLTQIAVSMLTTGNAYLFIEGRNVDGTPTGLKVLDPSLVDCDRFSDGRLFYRVSADFDNGVRTQRVVMADDMVHIRALMLPGDDVGIGPLDYAARSILLGVAEEEYAARRFATDGYGAAIPDGVVETDEYIDQEAADEFAQVWQAAAGGMNRGPVILHSGLRYKPLALSSEALQLLESRQFTARQICSTFGVAPHLVGVPASDGLTYKTVEGDTRALVRFGLGDLVNRVEQALSDEGPSTQVVEFETYKLLRPTIHERYQVHEMAIRSGVRTAEEVREEEGYGPMPEGVPVPAMLVPDTEDDDGDDDEEDDDE